MQPVKPAQIRRNHHKPRSIFAYPFDYGIKRLFLEIKKSGYKMAFILATKRDSIDPPYVPLGV
jgi:hypothetical protein